MTTLISIAILIASLSLTVPTINAGEFVVGVGPGKGVGLGGVLSGDNFLGIPIRDLGGAGGLLTILIQTATIIAGIGFFLYLLFGGLRWMTSGGDKVATQAARETITSALIGLLIVLSVYAIIRVLEAAFGLTILSGGIKFPSPI
ncbi:MAG: hypothetical protein A2802_00905 [Candidatus Woykebacteria bacterium RIFCSPHIGHO2_01_FULL_43_29]|uniref:Uncharacterized protein n=2 Tax=Candidatus Woykeibacteriota TaxID=1817899 RepID=A0A1G1WU45_9BACT|nr:MAG: hypothetical protein A2802_00905 [Candidatus Woykebacteria bacterium RIFCSPHIGHO2_01_FULL_43_29]OGY28471.1 MAG: hypothetical protein A3J50_00410 [Candidatus Woykebacteria bacterium RIFCSPHIGHO2_02_FULL_43_16b]OGY31091.1 MAG: hypothetical protein A3A61_04000 [Candidatus Woykebacteria bacterium RIFCSPLOWO2_01_FULL_43_14]